MIAEFSHFSIYTTFFFGGGIVYIHSGIIGDVTRGLGWGRGETTCPTRQMFSSPWSTMKFAISKTKTSGIKVRQLFEMTFFNLRTYIPPELYSFEADLSSGNHANRTASRWFNLPPTSHPPIDLHHGPCDGSLDHTPTCSAIAHGASDTVCINRVRPPPPSQMLLSYCWIPYPLPKTWRRHNWCLQIPHLSSVRCRIT